MATRFFTDKPLPQLHQRSQLGNHPTHYNHRGHYKPAPHKAQQHQQQQLHPNEASVQKQAQQGGYCRSSTEAHVHQSLRKWFDAIDTDRSGTLNCVELGRALICADWTPFNGETVRLMMNMFGRDNDGTISFDEFIGLWQYIERWKACFRRYDFDASGTIDSHELLNALRAFGYNLSEEIVALIVRKYDVRGKGDISFDNFVQSCVTIQTLTDSFRRIDVAGVGVVSMTYEQVAAPVAFC
ncbi:Programmed cell death protein 6 [Podila minutissima]|uniref:Programmed cell death protein 6 n=1 Tax=Podila minutissima TaxID=64525 RepID=A0A9P5SK01_9FUNG|nr:Programmed cell death protein 6 [Podila minutissima]